MTQDISASTHFTGDLLIVTGSGILTSVSASSGDAVIRDGTTDAGTPIWEQPIDSASGAISIAFRSGLFVDAGAGLTGGAISYVSSA